MHITSIKTVDDMITLGEIQEHSILRNLRLRYKQRLFYVSFIGEIHEYIEILYNQILLLLFFILN